MRVRCRVKDGGLPRNLGGGGGELEKQVRIHPKIQSSSLKTEVFEVAAEGQERLICLWIFRCFSSLSFAKISSVSVVRLRRERTSLAPLAQALLFPLCPLCSTLPGSKLEGEAAPIDLGGREQRDRGSPAPCASGEQKTHPVRVGLVLLKLVGR